MAVPRAAGQTGLVGQLALALNQPCVDAPWRSPASIRQRWASAASAACDSGWRHRSAPSRRSAAARSSAPAAPSPLPAPSGRRGSRTAAKTPRRSGGCARGSSSCRCLQQRLQLRHVARTVSARLVNSNGSRSASASRITAVPDGLRQRAAVDEVGVGEMRVPVEVVVDRVIDAAARPRRRSRGSATAMPRCCEERRCSPSPSRARRSAGRPASRASARSVGRAAGDARAPAGASRR